MIKTVKTNGGSHQTSLRDSASIALTGPGTCAEQGNGGAVAKNHGRAVGHGDAHKALGEHRAIVQLQGNAYEIVTDVGTPIHAAILKPRGAQNQNLSANCDMALGRC